MIFRWSRMNILKKEKEDHRDMHHQILGTPLKVHLKANESEILFGCGCFWGAEKGFWKLPGVISTAVGYAGGNTETPSYKEVCSGVTGHTEAVRVTWDKSKIDTSDLLKLFWECHDPTQGDRQGNDYGSQYRSAIFTYNENDYKLAIDSKNSYQEALEKHGFKNITTEIKKDQKFHYAEGYHQQYLAKPGSRPYCSAMPTNVRLEDFPNSNYKLAKSLWEYFDWSQTHCVLRSDNQPIKV